MESQKYTLFLTNSELDKLYDLVRDYRDRVPKQLAYKLSNLYNDAHQVMLNDLKIYKHMKTNFRDRNFTPEQKALFDKAEEAIEQNRDCISNISVADRYIDTYDTMVLSVCGGQNGGGNWIDYFKGLSNMVSVLENDGIHCWLLGGWNDCLDDVFNFEFGIKAK